MKVAVVTGASAGVGRATAVTFAQNGWRVALIARSQTGLESTRAEIEGLGGTAMLVVADVSDDAAVFAAADEIVGQWGVIDVWINNAMVTAFAPVTAMQPSEIERITAVSYLGTAFGTMAALKHMRPRNAGTIIQVGSALSYRAIPLQSAYCGAKFAIRGFTNALRSELKHDRSNIKLSMVQLPAVNTPQFDWAHNALGFDVRPVPPIHQPEAIAEAIYQAAQTAPRELWIGLSVVKAIIGDMLVPGFLDDLLARKAYEGQITEHPRPAGVRDNLRAPPDVLYTMHGRFDGIARNRVTAFNPVHLKIGIVFSLIVGVLLAALLSASS